MIHNVILNKKHGLRNCGRAYLLLIFLMGNYKHVVTYALLYSTYESKTLPDGEKILAPHLPGRKVKIFTSNTESASEYVSQKAS